VIYQKLIRAFVILADNFTALHQACAAGHTQVVQLLLRAGASAVSVNKSAETPLHLACYGGHSAVVQWLLAAGAAVNALNEFDETPLLYAGEALHM
jgi:ankyrin repeat protein